MATIILSLSAESFDDRIYAKNVNISSVQNEMVSALPFTLRYSHDSYNSIKSNQTSECKINAVYFFEIPSGGQSGDKYVEFIVIGAKHRCDCWVGIGRDGTYRRPTLSSSRGNGQISNEQ